MNKGLSLFFLVIFSIAGFGQTKKPAAGEAGTGRSDKGSPAAKKAASPAKTPAVPEAKSGLSIGDPANETAPAEPTPDPEADKTRFQQALAGETAADKARLLRSFLDEFPASEAHGEAVEYLVTARAMAGSEKLQAGDTAGAVSSFKLAIDEAPAVIPDRLYTDVILRIPANLFYRGGRASALELAQQVEKKVAANPKQLLGLVTFYLSIENGSEARRVAEAALALDPESAAGYQALGLAHRLNFDLEASAKAYARALELDPASIPARRSLAELKRALGKPDEAAAIYRSILAVDETDIVARSGLALSLFDSGKQVNAETELTRALEADPKNFGLLAGAAYWYAATNNGQKAIEYGQKAIDAEPRYVWGHIALARGLMKQNKPVEAERALLKARQYGNFPSLEYEIASARFKAGFFREAVEELTKSFKLENGMLKVNLGGRVAKEADNFQELVAFERKASILQPMAADDADTAAKLRVLMEMRAKAEEGGNEIELASLADQFVKGEDKMKLHRQLYAANLLLQKNIALPKVAELVKASVGNTDAGLEVSAPAAAVMASELYESRTIAFSRNEVVIVPEVPRQTLSAILRGRIEELAGWTLYQQKNYPDAIVRLRRAISVLPKDSAWWRSSLWHLGAALEADGKDQEALDSYIQSYKTDRPGSLRYGVIEALYRKINGNVDGLEEKIGINPSAPVAAVTKVPEPAATSTVASETQPAEARLSERAEPLPSVPVKAEQATTATAETAAETKIVEPRAKPDGPETVSPKPSGSVSSEAPPEKSEPSGAVVSAPEEKIDASAEQAAGKLPTAAAEIKPAASPAEIPKGEPVETSEARKEPNKPDKPVETVPETPPERAKETPPQTSSEQTTKVSGSTPEQIEVVQPKPDEKPESLTTTVDTVPKETETIRPNLKPNAEPVGEAAKTDPGQRPEPEAKVQETPAQPAAAVEGAEKPDDSLATRSKLNPPLRKPLLIVDDPLKKDEKRSTAKELFEPVIINVPRRDGGQRAGEPTAEGRKQDAETATPGATRRRLVEGKEVISDQQCTIDVSKNVISLLSNGGSVGVLVSVTGAGQAADISAGSSSLRDIEVRSEPEIAGLAGRRFYVIKAISDKAGIYQVNFESPCGKKEITVHVR